MASTTYEQVIQSDIQDKVEAAYRSSIDALKQMGFRELTVLAEIEPPWSGIIYLPIVALMKINKEVIEMRSPLRPTTFHPLLASKEHATYAYASSLGITFSTNFADGTGLVSKNYQLGAMNLGGEKLHMSMAKRSPQETWDFHREQIQRLESEGHTLRHKLCFEDYVELARREEAAVRSAKMVFGRAVPMEGDGRVAKTMQTLERIATALFWLGIIGRALYPNSWLVLAIMAAGAVGEIAVFISRLPLWYKQWAKMGAQERRKALMSSFISLLLVMLAIVVIVVLTLSRRR